MQGTHWNIINHFDLHSVPPTGKNQTNVGITPKATVRMLQYTVQITFKNYNLLGEKKHPHIRMI